MSSESPYTVSNDKSALDLRFVHHELSRSYWAKNIPFDIVKRSIENSLCFGIFLEGKQIGFARVITDSATFAYLCDVIIAENFRGKGAGKFLMRAIMSHPDLQGLRKFMLGTLDAHGLYSGFGFGPLKYPERIMDITVPDIYDNTPGM